MAARFYIAVAGVIAGCAGLALPGAGQGPPVAVPQPMPAEKDAVRDALKAVRAGLELPAVVAPPANPPESLPAPAPLPVAPSPTPAPAPVPTPVPAPPLALPPLPVEPPVVAPLGGGLTVDGRPIDLSTFRTRLGGGCAACGHDDCETCGGSRHCSPGRTACEPFPAKNRAERVIGVLYETVCCPDPCYEPKWTALADAAYFTASARPVTHARFRWDAGLRVVLPDRAEYFWARADGLGLGPRPVGPNRTATRVNYHELSMYTEIAVTGSLATIIDLPYRTNSAVGASPGAGFGDLRIGTKTLMFDRELVQVALQFLTYLPTGQPTKGTGVGHVSLEPSLIVGLKLSSETYLQAQFGDWIPLGGFPGYSGGVLQYNLSLNHTLWRPVRDVQLIGTWEVNALTFLDGSYTDPTRGPNQRAVGMTYVSAGPGIRLNICDKLDFGAGSSFALTDPHFAAALFRTEFRYRY
ncbi:hypothetical protein [Gemmata sp.]|uniref:hypothetical protein n=1 Tax=Gemmata sp. TaxID=1914242 RepID=UPI003F6F8FDF